MHSAIKPPCDKMPGSGAVRLRSRRDHRRSKAVIIPSRMVLFRASYVPYCSKSYKFVKYCDLKQYGTYEAQKSVIQTVFIIEFDRR